MSLEAAIVTVAAKIFGPIVRPIGRYVVRPIARRCPFKNLWDYESNLEDLNTKLKELEARRVSVQGLTNAGVEPLHDVKDWLHRATDIINEVSGVICEDNRRRQQTGCCEGCSYSHLKECYQHRNNVARKLKDVAQLLQKAMESSSLWESKSNLENLKNEVKELVARRESVQRLIKDGEEPLPHVKVWQESVDSIINEVSRLINENNPEHQNDVARKLIDVAQLLQIARGFGQVSTISKETEYKRNLENLKKEVEELEARRETVQLLIKDGEEPLPHVKLWQESVDSIINEVSRLINENNPEHQNDVAQLLQEAREFKEVSHRTIPEEPWLQSRNGYEAFESRESILKNIIDALSNPDVYVVGIYGMGGVGKTTLAKEVARQVEGLKLFNEIVFADVSDSPDIRKIQGEIGDKLGMRFCEETISGRARRLYDRLTKVEKILVILDNIWGSIDLEKIGIPFYENHKGCKLLLTTRSRDVLTNKMDSKNNFPIEALDDDDAWKLFKRTAGACSELPPSLQSVARDVAEACAGVPIAIVTVAKALKDKDISEWNKALRELRRPTPESFEGVTSEVYLSIQLSYNHLETEELKSIFLLCGTMACIYNFSVRDLLRYGMGLGLFMRIQTMEEAQDNVDALVSKLKASSLLLNTYNGERFAIHDVVRDVAKSIASRDRHMFTVIDTVPRNWAHEDTLKSCTAISLHDIAMLPQDLVCPQLKFFYVKGTKASFRRFPHNYFIGMPRLQVLHLVEMDLCSLPTSLNRLINLQTLCLDHCNLGDIAIIGNLKKLEILSIRNSNIKKLTREIHQLTKLRLLDLSDCDMLRVIPPNVLSSFTQLEALYMGNTFFQWEVEGPDIARSNASLDELKYLCHLTTLEIQIPDAKCHRACSPQSWKGTKY